MGCPLGQEMGVLLGKSELKDPPSGPRYPPKASQYSPEGPKQIGSS